MSAYSTRTISKDRAKEIFMEYKALEYKKFLETQRSDQLEEMLNYFSQDYPDLYVLTNWNVEE